MARLKRQNILTAKAMIRPLSQPRNDDDGTDRILRNVSKVLSFYSEKKKKKTQISFTMQQKPAVTHYSGSLPLKATRLMVMIKMAMEYVPALQYDVTWRMLLADSRHKATECSVLHFNISTALTNLS